MLTFLIVCAGNEPKDKGRTIMEENLKIPAHVALILDGNGRWAKKRGLPRQLGHKRDVRHWSRSLRTQHGLESGI